MTNGMGIAALVMAIISLAGVIYAFAFWRGEVGNQLKGLSTVPERLAKLETKTEVIWAAFIDQILAKNPGLVQRGSGYELTENAMRAVRDVKNHLKADNPGIELVAEQILLDIPHRLGIVKLKSIAEKHEITLAELLAILSVDLENGEEKRKPG